MMMHKGLFSILYCSDIPGLWTIFDCIQGEGVNLLKVYPLGVNAY